MSTFDPAVVLKKLSIEYQGRAEAIRRDLARGHSADSAEQATERQNDEVLEALLVEAETALQQVNKAHERLQQGTYGSCSKCGEVISAARLAVMPMTECCVQCAN